MSVGKKISALTEASDLEDYDEFVVINKDQTEGEDAGAEGQTSKVTLADLKIAVGSQGAEGPPGSPGLNGPIGEKGSTGSSGMNGADGQDGQDGQSGVAGTNGQDGSDGADGAKGDTGAVGATFSYSDGVLTITST